MKRIAFLLAAIATIAVVVAIGWNMNLPSRFSIMNTAHAAPPPNPSDGGAFPDLGGAVTWLNSPPLTTKSLRGKVVLVDFWTYSCINSLRQLSYVMSWSAKYKDAGLVVIGVHAPEFEFEKNRANVEWAVRELKITYPVPMDSDHKIWRAFNNQYWPADYIIDAKGRIRYHHFGEGEYARSERIIQQLLKENGAKGIDESLVSISGSGIEAPASRDEQTPETYVGYQHGVEQFASPERLTQNSVKTYSSPEKLSLNQWAFAGSWNVGAESAALPSAPGKIVFRFHSRDLHIVLTSSNGKPIRYKVRLDGAAPGADHGVDSAPDGSGEVREPRLYQLIRQKGPIQDRTFEIEFLDPGVQAFVFTFG